MNQTIVSGATMETCDGRRQNALSMLLVLAAAVAFLLRFGLSPQLMDRVVGYTTPGGAFYEKLHFGTDAIFIVCIAAFIVRPVRLWGEDIRTFSALLRYCLLVAALVPYLVIAGRAGSAGFVIDTYLVAGAAGLLMLTFDAARRRLLGDTVVVMILVSAILGIVEAISHHRILPYDLVELEFRPIGLTVHPLAQGALCATGIGFAAASRWRLWLRIAAIAILFIGCATSGARIALLVSVAEIIALIVLLRWPGLSRRHQWQAKGAVLLFVTVAGAALAAAMFAAGLLNRFGQSLFDENFMARVTIYRVFDYVGWKEILFGMRADDLLAIVHEQLHLPAIESAVVVIVLLFGIPLTLLFVMLVGWMFYRLLRHAPMAAWIGTITFLLAAVTNNTLSSKTPEIAMLFVLLLAYGDQPALSTTSARPRRLSV
jgi:hypothetical protein